MICSQHYKEVSGKLELIHKKLLKDAHRRKWKEADWTNHVMFVNILFCMGSIFL